MRAKPVLAAMVVVTTVAFSGCSQPRTAALLGESSQARQQGLGNAGFVDDASHLNRTWVREVWDVPQDSAAAEEQLRKLLERAQRDGLKVSIAGTRHTMGGHTIAAGGIVLNMRPFRSMRLSEDRSVLHVQAGATWEEVISFLNPHGRSVSVMQSNNSFSVGGSLSANVHGWQHNAPPIGSSVRSFRLLQADGTVVRCSRSENPELFSLVLGGYGLFGVILDAELWTVPNERYQAERFLMPTREYVRTFDEKVNGTADVAMVYGRLSIDPDMFLEEALLMVFRRRPRVDGHVPALTEPAFVPLTRALFRRSAGSDEGKRLRWLIEKNVTRLSQLVAFSRNQLLNTSVDVYALGDPDKAEILHEYFIPPSQFAGFVTDLRRIVRKHHLELLNVTIRNVHPDEDGFLRYARQEVLGLVILFHQPRTAGGEAVMQTMTQDLVNAALARGGTYYLPYRLHATVEQLERAYPQARDFFALKRKYDPAEVFQNEFYRKYAPHEP